VWIGLGTAAKLFPLLLLVPLLLDVRRRRRDGAAGMRRLALGAGGAWLAVNLPFVILAFPAWSTFWRFSVLRPVNLDSIWAIFCPRLLGHISCAPGSTPWVAPLSIALFLGGAVLVYRLRARIEPDFPRWTFVLPLVALFLLVSKVYSPQFSLWLLPLFALALPSWRAFIAFEIADVFVFVSEMMVLADIGLQFEAGWPFPVLGVALVLRAAALVWCLASWVRGARTAKPRPAIAPAPASP
jgi:uncharacterized membrane protein